MKVPLQRMMLRSRIQPLDPALTHAIFLSGNDDRSGNLMNKLALINIETMKMAKQNGYYIYMYIMGLKKTHRY